MSPLKTEVEGQEKDLANDADEQGNKGGNEPEEETPEYEYPELEVPEGPSEEGSRPELDREAAVLELLSSQQEANRLLAQRLEVFERRLTQQPAQQPTNRRTAMPEDDLDDDDAPVTTPQDAGAVLLKELRRMRAENQQLRQQVRKEVEDATYGLRREAAEEKLTQMVEELNAKYGEGVFDKYDIIRVKNENPGLSLQAAKLAAEHRRAAALQKAGYRRQVVKDKGNAPAVPGRFDHGSRPAFQPAKRATTMEELRRNTEEALRHSGFDELVAEANRVRDARLKQMEDMG